jgi:HK97 family phage portal protein
MPSPVTAESALSVPAFWRGHALVCGGLGALPVHAWRGTEQLVPQPLICRRPDPEQTAMSFWTGVASAVTLYGNSLCVVTGTDRLGYPNGLRAVHPLNAAAHFTGNPNSPTIAGWYLAGAFYDPSEVWHIKSHLHRPGWPLGMGLLDAVAEGISMAQGLQDFQASFFKSGGVPTGIVKVHRPEVSQDTADEIKAQWLARFAGSAEPAVLNELTDFTPVAFRPVDSQMIEAAGQTIQDIANMWGIPGAKLGSPVSSGTYRTSIMEELQARQDGIAPWAHLFEQALSDILPGGQDARWDLEAYLRADPLSRFQAYQAALGGPGPASKWIEVNEVRAQENLDPLTPEELAALVDPSVSPADDPEADPDPTTPLPPASLVPAMNGVSP